MPTEQGDNPPAKCFRMDSEGNLPTCTSTGDGEWVVSYPDAMGGPGDGIPGAFVALVMLGLVLGVIGVLWRMGVARQIARSAGMDERQAGRMAVMTDDGLEATYLAASLRGAAPEPTAASDRPAVAERLEELQRLREQGLVTEEECAAARRKILGDL
ncbi:MAG: SHOCT domain-containing protein [Nocardioides sp.]